MAVERPKNSPVGCQMGYTGETIPIPSSRWLMSVVGSPGCSLDDCCSFECPGAMRRLGAMRSLSPASNELPSGLTRCCSSAGAGVASMEGCPTRHVVLRRVLVR